jgi:hypothetical protein
MIQEQKKIYDFKKGDVITRILPMITAEGSPDYSFVGKKFIFKGIANASIYLSRELDLLSAIFTGMETLTVQLPLALAEDGWAIYVDPVFLDMNEIVVSESERSIQAKIEKAIDEDDYEQAEMLKKKLENLKNKK